jgi:hypothetical protein
MVAEANVKGEALKFTKVCMGDGELGEKQDMSTLADMINPVLEVPIISGENQGNGKTKLRFTVSNENLEKGFRAREIGVFAKIGEDGEEKLYAYTNGGNYVDYVPSKEIPIDAQIVDVYFITGNARQVQIEVGNAAAVTVLDLDEHDKSENSHGIIVAELKELMETHGLNMLKRNKAYKVGDIAYSPNLPSWARLECVKAGTTDTEEPDFTTLSAGGVLLIDGTAQFIIDDVRDCTPVGSIRGSLYLPTGYVKANGAEVSRADYPRLVALADKYNLWNEDTDNYQGMFGVGDGETTMTLPNWTDRMQQFSDSAGATIAAGLPNITGTVGVVSDSCSGAFVRNESDNFGDLAGTSSGGWRIRRAFFYASRSNAIYGNSDTVQPPAISMLPIIRY